MVLPPDTNPLPVDWLNKLEGYINAIKMQKDAFDTSGFRYSCQSQNVDPAVLLKAQTLSTTLAAFKADVDNCIGLANS